jgi:NTP pyrophosphatase (non-canonical NTP hydrolase)
MKEKSKQEIYKLALYSSGEIFQLDMMNEEAAELIQAINKYKRALKYNPSEISSRIDDIASELADVSNLIEQLKYDFDNSTDVDYNFSELVEKYKVKKLKRIKKRILNRNKK